MARWPLGAIRRSRPRRQAAARGCGTHVRYVARAGQANARFHDALTPDDIKTTLDLILDPAVAVARALNIDRQWSSPNIPESYPQ